MGTILWVFAASPHLDQYRFPTHTYLFPVSTEDEMARTPGRDWTLIRDEWANRRLAGEPLTLKALAA